MKSKNTIYIIKGLIEQLSEKYKIKLIVNLFLILISSGLEIVSLSLIYPLLSFATDSEKILNNPIVLGISENLNIQQEKNILLITCLFLIFTVILSSISKLFSLKYSILLTQKIGSELASKALANFLNQDYETHLNRNSSEIIATINLNIDGAIAGINPFI